MLPRHYRYQAWSSRSRRQQARLAALAGIDFKVGSRFSSLSHSHRGDLRPCHVTSRSRPFWLSGVPRAKLLAVLVTVALSSICALSQVRSDHGHFNKKGNLLISDQFNNRVIEVERHGEIVWQFGLGPNDFSRRLRPRRQRRAARGGPHAHGGHRHPRRRRSRHPGGAADNRVILVDPAGRIVWQYGQFGVTGSDPNQLNTPVQAPGCRTTTSSSPTRATSGSSR